MKFDVVIGNPPYQGNLVGEKTSPPPIYHQFMNEAFKIGNKVSLITPGRFLFNTGRTPKKWNRKMLKDKHLKVTDYEPLSSNVFENTDIKGGVVITYRDKEKMLGPIGTFTAYSTLNDILHKINPDEILTLDEIIFSQAVYKFNEKMHSSLPETLDILSKGNEKAVGTGVLDTLNNLVFFKSKPKDEFSYIQFAGLMNSERVYMWARRDYIKAPSNLNKWKVFVTQANGSGALGEILSSPFVAKPYVGHTQTFISIGSFDTELEAESCLKYIKTKFVRALLGVLKVTQHNPPRTWAKIPLQDFTTNSDIDWSKSISEIDQQLYNKYNLNKKEIKFIENNIKEME